MVNWSFDSQKYFKNNSQHSTQEDAKSIETILCLPIFYKMLIA